jgi:hypothetical protein
MPRRLLRSSSPNAQVCGPGLIPRSLLEETFIPLLATVTGCALCLLASRRAIGSAPPWRGDRDISGAHEHDMP